MFYLKHYIGPAILCIVLSWFTYKVHDLYNQVYNDHSLLMQVVSVLNQSRNNK